MLHVTSHEAHIVFFVSEMTRGFPQHFQAAVQANRYIGSGRVTQRRRKITGPAPNIENARRFSDSPNTLLQELRLPGAVHAKGKQSGKRVVSRSKNIEQSSYILVFERAVFKAKDLAHFRQFLRVAPVARFQPKQSRPSLRLLRWDCLIRDHCPPTSRSTAGKWSSLLASYAVLERADRALYKTEHYSALFP